MLLDLGQLAVLFFIAARSTRLFLNLRSSPVTIISSSKSEEKDSQIEELGAIAQSTG